MQSVEYEINALGQTDIACFGIYQNSLRSQRLQCATDGRSGTQRYLSLSARTAAEDYDFLVRKI
jgi:hypothetical protein